jgi:large subunit ribosomal protein L6
MSRIANNPVAVPDGVNVSLEAGLVTIKGPKGELQWAFHDLVAVEHEAAEIRFKAVNDSKQASALAGTTRALVNNMVTGVSQGFEKKLTIIGVGYRVQVQGQKLNLTLGFSHPVIYMIPEGVKADAPSQTEIVLTGADKQKVGQVAAEIRAFRPPEPYKGKGIRYSDEHVVRKQAKKK